MSAFDPKRTFMMSHQRVIPQRIPNNHMNLSIL